MKYIVYVMMLLVVIGGLLFALTAEAEPVVYEVEKKVEIEKPKPVILVIETEEQRIERLVREEFIDAPVMVAIARCESRFKNVPSLTGDFGPFQINQVHTKTLKAMNLDRTVVEDNIKYARFLYTQSGVKPWENSRHCWGIKNGA